MVTVTVDSGPIDAEDHPRDVPQSRWRDLLLARRTYLDIRLPHDCRMLVRFRQEAEDMCEVLGFKSADDLVREAYGLDPAEINAAVEWLTRNRPKRAISLPDVRLKTKSEAGAMGGRGHKATSNTSSFMHSSRAGWLAKLERDAQASPDVKLELERVKSGESSPHAAAVRLGWRSKKHCRTCQCF